MLRIACKLSEDWNQVSLSIFLALPLHLSVLRMNVLFTVEEIEGCGKIALRTCILIGDIL